MNSGRSYSYRLLGAMIRDKEGFFSCPNLGNHVGEIFSDIGFMAVPHIKPFLSILHKSSYCLNLLNHFSEYFQVFICMKTRVFHVILMQQSVFFNSDRRGYSWISPFSSKRTLWSHTSSCGRCNDFILSTTNTKRNTLILPNKTKRHNNPPIPYLLFFSGFPIQKNKQPNPALFAFFFF